jgi:hypothetical protein
MSYYYIVKDLYGIDGPWISLATGDNFVS